SVDTTPQTINVNADGKTYKVSFKDNPTGTLVIKKLDYNSKEPLANAEFKVTTSSGDVVGNSNGIYKTDATGTITIPYLDKDSYVITEIKSPDNYILENQSQTISIDYGKTYTLSFYNKKMSGLQIIKINSVTKQPLKGAEFAVYKKNGELVGRYVTDADGVIIIDTLPPNWYKIVETKTLDGYILDDVPKDVEITDNQFVKVVFENAPMSTLIIRKVEADTLIPLEGAEFNVKMADGTNIGNYRSDADGTVTVSALVPGVYTVTETKAPANYSLGDSVQTVEIAKASTVTVEFQNRPYGSLVIKKIDEITQKALAGADFDVYHQGGSFVGNYTTGVDGTVNIGSLEPGFYVVSETRAPTGYSLDNTAKTIEIKAVVPTVATFSDKPLSGIEVLKTDAVTHKSLTGATFEVTKANGEKVGTYKTDNAGKIIVSDLTEGVYVISETIAPDGYERDENPQTVTVISGKLTSVEFADKPYSGIAILKTDEFSHIPLTGATFEVAKADGEKVGTYKTDSAGKIIVSDLSEGVYVVSETIAPYGYVKSEIPQTVTVKSGKLTQVEFTDRPVSGIEIVKQDYFTKTVLSGATFVVERSDGLKVGEFTTDVTGKTIVSGLTDGTYIISETVAPSNYMMSESPKTVVVTSGKLTSVTFLDKPLSGLEIIKLDKYTHLALSDATFEINRANGEEIATVKTDTSGKAIVSDLDEGFYIISEKIAPDNYQIDNIPQTVEVKSGKITEVQFEDKPLSMLKILKLNSETREPIAGVEFNVSRMNGEKIMNEFGNLTFTTDISGAIYIPHLAEGYYTITEIQAAAGYFIDSEPKTVLVEADKDTVLEVLNVPMASLLITKTDENTGKPLAGVVYDIKYANGSFVVGNIQDNNQPNSPNNSPSKSTNENGDVSGSYTTDANGRIQINGLQAGEYMVVERKALDNYELDTNVYNITVLPGKQATLQLTNKPKSGIRLTKIDSISKKPIFGVEFMLLDQNGKVVNVYYTDDNGVIDFPDTLEAGRYTIRETRPAPGYYADDMPRTVEFVAGQVTQITWENTPELGQIQITKKSADDNQQNSLPAGTLLAGATFEVRDYKSGALVDTITSGLDGRAVSKPLPLGRYTITEVKAPQYYILSDMELDVEIEFATQIIKREFRDYSANLGVYVKKVGNVEAMPNDTMRYDIKAIQNTSAVSLTDFYFRDVLPINAVRLTKLVTGTYSQSLKYKIMITTNRGDTRVIADNLSTTKNNVIDCSNASLGLKSDEFVTSFTFVFGTVRAGFSTVETPQIYVKVLPNLPNGFEFANKCDAGGRYDGSFVISNSTWLTTIFNPSPVKKSLPKTGF
ncbi:MAG: SpaA isopeptide-forming pilin-related protein, partial [Oscillospiraceae bacterium]|nr:SpaA isopeptide-forming pilin-related protein [Oscillospiraceae bacterium]